MSSYWPYLIVAAILVIAALAFYAGKLLKQLKMQTAAQEKAKQEHENSLKAHDKKILDSVIIIVRAMKEEQCDISEGCWRLSVLLSSMKTTNELKAEFPAIFELYEAIKHMPILEERKKLEKRDRMKLDLERAKVEARLTEDVFKDLEALNQYTLEKISILSL